TAALDVHRSEVVLGVPGLRGSLEQKADVAEAKEHAKDTSKGLLAGVGAERLVQAHVAIAQDAIDALADLAVDVVGIPLRLERAVGHQLARLRRECVQDPLPSLRPRRADEHVARSKNVAGHAHPTSLASGRRKGPSSPTKPRSPDEPAAEAVGPSALTS